MSKNLKKIGNFLILILFTGIVLYFSLKDNFNSIVSQILNINKVYFLLAIILMFGCWFLKSIVLKIITKKYNKNYSFKNALKLVIEVNFLNAITPFATGGQPYEIYSLRKHEIKIMDATNIVIQNFIIYQIALVFLGTLAVIYNYFFHLFNNDSILNHLVTIGFIINILVIVGLFLITYAKKFNNFILNKVAKFLIKIKIIRNPEKSLDKFNKYLDEFYNGANKLLENKKDFIIMIIYHFLSLVLLYLVPFILLLGMGKSINILEAILTSAYVMLIGSFVPIPGGTGGLEYGFIKFYGSFIKGPLLNAIMLLWRFITYYFGMILGAIVLNIKEKKI